MKSCSIKRNLLIEQSGVKSREKVTCWKINEKRCVDGRKLFESKCRGWLVVRLKAIKYYERLLCYLSSYNFLISDLWLNLDLWSRLVIRLLIQNVLTWPLERKVLEAEVTRQQSSKTSPKSVWHPLQRLIKSGPHLELWVSFLTYTLNCSSPYTLDPLPSTP